MKKQPFTAAASLISVTICTFISFVTHPNYLFYNIAPFAITECFRLATISGGPMTRRLFLMTLCALLYSNALLTARPYHQSWLSTPICTPVTTSEYYDIPYKHDAECGKISSCEYGCTSRCGFNAGLDLLYWTACQDNLDFAVDHTDSEGSPALLGAGSTHFLDYEWSPGVRGYFGFDFLGFGVRGQYTWIKNKAKKELDNTPLIASLLHPDTGISRANAALGSQDLWHQSAELLFSRETEFCDQKLILRPFIGAKWISLRQKLTVTYAGEDFDPNRELVRWDSTLSGPGAVAGVELFYRWMYGFGLFGKLSGSVVNARIENTHVQVPVDANGQEIFPPRIQLSENQRLTVPGYQMETGITWDMCRLDCYTVRFRICYEFTQWLNTPGLRRYHYANEGESHAATDGSIALHGGTFGIDLRF